MKLAEKAFTFFGGFVLISFAFILPAVKDNQKAVEIVAGITFFSAILGLFFFCLAAGEKNEEVEGK